MKTEKELRKMMKDKKYSGTTSERDASFIKEVETGFKDLYPEPGALKLQVNEQKVSEGIRNEKDNRLTQLTTLRKTLEFTKAKIAELISLTDKLEQTGNVSQLQKHFLECENYTLLLEILHNRIDIVGKQSVAANAAYQGALSETHPCFGCRHCRQDRIGKLCGFDTGQQSIPLEELKACPDTIKDGFNNEIPFISRDKRDLPSLGAG